MQHNIQENFMSSLKNPFQSSYYNLFIGVIGIMFIILIVLIFVNNKSSYTSYSPLVMSTTPK
jgi:hypothetical protein